MNLRWSRRATSDLRHAHAYIAADSLDAANEAILQVLTAIESLLNFPARGRPGRVFGTRELVIARTPYFVAYRIRDETIQILRVLHGAQAWPPS